MGRPTSPERRFSRSPAERLYGEQGYVVKDWGGRLPMAIVYANSYYIGMSNLGLHTLYRLLNASPEIVAERVFWEGERHGPPLSLESRRPLSDFAVLLFTIPYELDYFNIPKMLAISGIPVYAAEHDETQPLVLAGGACITANPMPLSPFFDGLCIGEVEAMLPGLVTALGEVVGGARSEQIDRLSQLPGVYVPVIEQAEVQRQFCPKLDEPVGTVVFTPDTELGDLYLMEAERGCGRRCVFCLVAGAFCPFRYHPVEQLLKQAGSGLEYRKRIGLVGPAVSDHPQLEELLAGLIDMDAGLSISSMRVKPISNEVIALLARGGVKSLAIAPEAGSQRLRDMVNKDVDEADILAAVGSIASAGIRQLKMYFMVGLPTETDEDVLEIADVAMKAKSVAEQSGKGLRLSLNVAPFVPKAGTPFQWLGMASLDDLERRLQLLGDALAGSGIELRQESPAWSQVQAVLSRGDSQLAAVLAQMGKLSLPAWRKLVLKTGLDTEHYARADWPTSERLPWSVVDTGTPIERLKRELARAASAAAR